MFVKQNTVLVYNIPKDFHSKDLRRFFHHSIETNFFKCFHFRHRKAQYIISKEIVLEPGTYSCIVKLFKESLVEKFIKTYNDRLWKENGVCRCKIYHIKVKVDNNIFSKSEINGKVLNLGDLYSDELKLIQEMRPSKLLKNGNVGTPLSHFIQMIKECSLPPSLLPKLGIHLQNLSMKRKHTNIPWNYTDPLSTDPIPKSYKDIEQAYIHPVDDEEEEEWDRYAKVHDDPYKLVPRERHYEQETEVVWEKGGPGLVWHMDLNYWEQFEEEAEREVDDWDVDFEGGDFRDNPVLKDGYKTFVKRNKSTKIPQRINTSLSIQEPSCFYLKPKKMKLIDDNTDSRLSESPLQYKPKKHNRKSLIKLNGEMGCFEKYSNNYGSTILKKYGWKKGRGLGQGETGITEAILADGQYSNDKRGFGYKGDNPNKSEK